MLNISWTARQPTFVLWLRNRLHWYYTAIGIKDSTCPLPTLECANASPGYSRQRSNAKIMKNNVIGEQKRNDLISFLFLFF